MTMSEQPLAGTLAEPRQDVAVHTQGVSKTYGERKALVDVSLEITTGEFYGLLGPNGAGKSTLLEIIVGHRQPDTGSATVLGLKPSVRDKEFARTVGVQTQTSAFFPQLTAIEHLQTIAALHRLPTGAAEHALARVDLTDIARQRVAKLSGGQKQRLGIACAVIHEPRVLFLDEPTAALDPQARRELWSLLKNLHSAGHTIVYTTHHLDEAERLCDRVALLKAGHIHRVGTPAELVESAVAAFVITVPAELPQETLTQLNQTGCIVTNADGELTIGTNEPDHVRTILEQTLDSRQIQVRTASLEDAYLEIMNEGGR